MCPRTDAARAFPGTARPVHEWRGADWSALYVGRVTNNGTAMAYSVWVSTSLHSGMTVSTVVTPDSLAPGEHSDFYAQDTRVPFFGMLLPVVVEVGWSATRP